MTRKGWLTVGLSLLLGTGLTAAASGAIARAARAQDVIDDGNITEHRASVQVVRWGEQGGEQGEIESPRWGDQSGGQGEVEAPRRGDRSGEQSEIESPGPSRCTGWIEQLLTATGFRPSRPRPGSSLAMRWSVRGSVALGLIRRGGSRRS